MLMMLASSRTTTRPESRFTTLGPSQPVKEKRMAAMAAVPRTWFIGIMIRAFLSYSQCSLPNDFPGPPPLLALSSHAGVALYSLSLLLGTVSGMTRPGNRTRNSKSVTRVFGATPWKWMGSLAVAYAVRKFAHPCSSSIPLWFSQRKRYSNDSRSCSGWSHPPGLEESH